MKRGPEDIERLNIIRLAKKTKKGIWKRVASIISGPRRRSISVNVGKINRYAKDGDIIIIPGKVLGKGNITKKFTTVSLSYSTSAIDKLKTNGCEVYKIINYIGKDVKGAKILI
ncbi:50S ribosomal protein L18e [Candidatus Micrarchaeota archaeon]|nr:50S ribosomal protein L18e [Candidatus Micrarchaeota archaeon]